MMSYTLTELGEDIRSDIRTFCEREVAPFVKEADRSGAFPEEVLGKASELGIGAVFLPEEWGGLSLSAEEKAAIFEELSFWDAGFAVSYMASCLAAVPVLAAGTPEQKEFCSARLLAGGFGAFCLTEDGAGSDINGIRTSLRPAGEDVEKSGYLLQGAKQFVTNGGVSDFYVVFARSPGEGASGGKLSLTAVLVPADSPGIHFGEKEQKLGIRASSTSEVFFDNVPIAASQIIGAPGEGKRLASGALDQVRIWVSAGACGIAERALRLSVSRVRERIQFGAPLSDSPVIQTKLADMYMRISAARGAAALAARLLDKGQPVTREAATAKCLASDAAFYCSSEAVQLFGGYGYMEDHPVEKLLRDAKIFQIFEGANEILRLLIGRDLIKTML